MLLTEPAADVLGPRDARLPRASEAPVGDEGLEGDGLRDDSCEDTRGEPGRLPALARRAAGTATGALGAETGGEIGGETGAGTGAGSGATAGGGWKDGIGRSGSSSGGGSLKNGGRGGKSSVSGGGSLNTGCGG